MGRLSRGGRWGMERCAACFGYIEGLACRVLGAGA